MVCNCPIEITGVISLGFFGMESWKRRKGAGKNEIVETKTNIIQKR